MRAPPPWLVHLPKAPSPSHGAIGFQQWILKGHKHSDYDICGNNFAPCFLIIFYCCCFYHHSRHMGPYWMSSLRVTIQAGNNELNIYYVQNIILAFAQKSTKPIISQQSSLQDKCYYLHFTCKEIKLQREKNYLPTNIWY